MHKIAIAFSVTAILLILPACGFPEVCNGREFDNNGPPCNKCHRHINI
jgi:hypothetical protein